MRILTLLLFAISFFSWIIFFHQNVEGFLEGGKGSLYLGVIFGSSFFLALLHIFINSKRFYFKNSFFIFLIFLLYFFIKVFYEDSVDVNYLIKYFIGTSSGLLFTYFLGLFFSLNIQFYLNAIKGSRFYAKITLMFIMTALVSYLASLILLLVNFSETIRDDKFLLEFDSASYQRPAMLMVITFIVTSTLFIYFIYSIKKYKFFVFNLALIVMLVIYIGITVLQSILSQLIGSNSGLVCTISIFLISISFILLALINNVKLKNFQSFSKKKILGFNWKPIVMFTVIGFVVLALIVIVVINAYNFDYSQMRLFGFGSSGSESSLETRMEILRHHISSQIAYNPIFGNFNVPKLSMGIDSYIHSFFISIQTHLGIIGLGIVLYFIKHVFIEIRGSENNLHISNLFLFSGFKIHSLLILIFLLALSTIATFFAWMPIWFAFSFLNPPIIYRNLN